MEGDGNERHSAGRVGEREVARGARRGGARRVLLRLARRNLRALRLAGRALPPVKHDRPVGDDGSFLMNKSGEWIRFGLNKKPGAEIRVGRQRRSHARQPA